MSTIAPSAPKATPIPFLVLNLSVAKKMPNSKTKIGLLTIITAALIGVVRFKPSKKHLIDSDSKQNHKQLVLINLLF